MNRKYGGNVGISVCLSCAPCKCVSRELEMFKSFWTYILIGKLFKKKSYDLLHLHVTKRSLLVNSSFFLRSSFFCLFFFFFFSFSFLLAALFLSFLACSFGSPLCLVACSLELTVTELLAAGIHKRALPAVHWPTTTKRKKQRWRNQELAANTSSPILYIALYDTPLAFDIQYERRILILISWIVDRCLHK